MKTVLLTFVVLFAIVAQAQSPATQIDAQWKAWQEAVARLQPLAEVKALRLKPDQLEALVAATMDSEASVDSAALTRRISGLLKDQDAANAILETWLQMKDLHGRTPDNASASKIHVKHLALQVFAALAKTEESTGSFRVASAAGPARAKELAQAALKVTPDTPDAHYAMGHVLAEDDDAVAAEAEYRKALAADANSASGHVRLADVLREKGSVPEAMTELREALRLNPDSPLAHTDLGIILAALGNADEAVKEFREAIRIDRDFIEAHNNLAISLARQRRIADAIGEFREIVRIDPDSALGYYNLASALADMDQDQESAAALREVIRINPNHFNAHYNIGELFRLEGKLDEAVTQFREYLRLAPNTPQNQRNIKRAQDFVDANANR